MKSTEYEVERLKPRIRINWIKYVLQFLRYYSANLILSCRLQ